MGAAKHARPGVGLAAMAHASDTARTRRRQCPGRGGTGAGCMAPARTRPGRTALRNVRQAWRRRGGGRCEATGRAEGVRAPTTEQRQPMLGLHVQGVSWHSPRSKGALACWRPQGSQAPAAARSRAAAPARGRTVDVVAGIEDDVGEPQPHGIAKEPLRTTAAQRAQRARRHTLYQPPPAAPL